jgi:hypothetical protein
MGIIIGHLRRWNIFIVSWNHGDWTLPKAELVSPEANCFRPWRTNGLMSQHLRAQCFHHCGLKQVFLTLDEYGDLHECMNWLVVLAIVSVFECEGD